MAQEKPAPRKNAGEKPQGPTTCCCPYCETEVEAQEMSPFCKPCGIKLKRCPSCLVVLEPEDTVCRKCGKPVK